MSEPMPSPEELSQQALKYLLSLQEAGVEWLPRGESVRSLTVKEAVSAPVPSSDETLVTTSSALFQAEAPPDRDIEERRTELKLLAEQVSGCTRCKELASTRTQTVFGVGPLDAELCFLGEAPGADEDAQGIPFVGKAGQLLNRIIEACGFKREEVYICNILRCRPPGNRTPLPDEAGNCREYLDKQLELIRPKYICTLGACAAQNLLGTDTSVGRLRGRFHDYEGITVVCTYHPSYLLRSPEKKRDTWDDMKMLLRRMGREIPEQKKR